MLARSYVARQARKPPRLVHNIMKKLTRTTSRLRRHRRVRAKISGTTDVPRVSVFRSNRHTFIQIIDDTTGKTIVSTSDILTQKKIMPGNKIARADNLGQAVAEKAQKLGITKIVFDRGGYKYHGRVKAIADAMRKAGLQF